MKYLIIVLFLASPSFATLPEASEVRNNADKINEDAVKQQLPKFLGEVESLIWQQSNSGFYNAAKIVNDYDDTVLNKICDILNEKGYHTSIEYGRHGLQYLNIEWK